MNHYEAKAWIRSDENINMYSYVSRANEPEHTHEFIEVVYVLSGKGRHSIDGTWYEVERGNLLFINFGQTHAFTSQESMELVNCLIQPEFIHRELINSENAFEMLVLTEFKDFSLGPDKLTPMLLFKGKDMLEVENIISFMLDEFSSKRTNYRTALKGYLLVLLTRIFRAMQNADPAGILNHMNRIAPDILQYIEEKCFERITLQELARKCFYSPTYFSRIFRDYSGKSLTEYINDKRIIEAARLIRETNLSIEEISRRVGYSDRKQFYKIFKTHMGVTPSSLRQGR